MARRYSASQARSKLRQAQQKIKQAENKYKQGIRKLNREINKYNQAARQHNSRVRANQQRLRRELSRLSRNTTTTTTRYVVYRTSVQTLSDAYVRFENRAESNQIGPEYNRFLDLAERETANSVAVANRLLGAEPDESESVDTLQDAALGNRLREISPDLDDRWQGAVYSLNPSNPDAARHFCTSTRELFTQLLEMSAPDESVFATLPDAPKTDRGNATRQSKIRYLLHRQGMVDETLEEFVETNMENIVQLFHVLNDGTHGSAGTFGSNQLTAIKKRVEDGITFLTEIIGNA